MFELLPEVACGLSRHGRTLRQLTENFKSNNSSLWCQLTALGPISQHVFLSRRCPMAAPCPPRIEALQMLPSPVSGHEHGLPRMLFGRKPSVSPCAEHEDDPIRRRTKPHAGAERLHKIHGTIYPEMWSPHHAMKPCATNYHGGQTDHNRWPFATLHHSSLGTTSVPPVCGPSSLLSATDFAS